MRRETTAHGPTIPMRGQEIARRSCSWRTLQANHPHEGSGAIHRRPAATAAPGQPSP